MGCSSSSRTRGSIQASATRRSSPFSVEKAMAGMPLARASMVTPMVPEYRMSVPTLYPWLMPEKTRSGFSGMTQARATLTQSAGEPLTVQARTPSTG